MDRREERILHRAEKAGVKLAKKEGRIPTREEVLQTKIQILSGFARWTMFGGSLVSGFTCWYFLSHEMLSAGSVAAVLAAFLLLFSIFGIKRTLETLADQLSYEIVDVVFEAIGNVVGSVFD